MLDVVVWERGAQPLGFGAVSRVATMPPGPAKDRRLASRDREQAFRSGTPAHAFPFGFGFCRSPRFLSGLARPCWGLVGIPLRLLRVPTKKFARRLRSLCRLSERTHRVCQVGGRLRRTWPNFSANASKSRGPTATDSPHRSESPSSGLQAAVIGVKRNHKDGRQRVPQPGSPGGRHAPRAAGVLSGLVASWVKAFSEPRLQAVAESILPPSPAQKLDVGADPSGHPQNMPPAVIVGRIASALGHRRLTDGQRVSAQRVIHYAVGTGLGVAYNRVATRWPAVTRGTGSLAGLAIQAGPHGSALPALRMQRPPWRLARAAVA